MKHRIGKANSGGVKLVLVSDYEEHSVGELNYFVCRVAPRNWVAFADLSGMMICELSKSKSSLMKELGSRIARIGEEGVAKNAKLDKDTAKKNHENGLSTMQYRAYVGLPIRQRKR